MYLIYSLVSGLSLLHFLSLQLQSYIRSSSPSPFPPPFLLPPLSLLFFVFIGSVVLKIIYEVVCEKQIFVEKLMSQLNIKIVLRSSAVKKVKTLITVVLGLIIYCF